MVIKRQLSSFALDLPPKVLEFLLFITNEKFQLTLVGGSVRDYLLTNKLSFDLDFEIRGESDLLEKEWKAQLKHLMHRIENNFQIKVEALPFSIMRVQIQDHTLEFASPRIETYQTELLEYGHKDFEVSLFSNLPYEKAFSRRDFTINALGIEMNSGLEVFHLIDPFGGEEDLRQKRLKPCGEDFFKDPVRFLRMLRFALRFSFKLDPLLEQNLFKFNLKSLSSQYFLDESFKSSFFEFGFYFFQTVKKNNIPIPEKLEKISKIYKHELVGRAAYSPSEVIATLVLASFPEQEIFELSFFMGTKKDLVRDLKAFYDNFVSLLKFLPQMANDVRKFSFEQISYLPLLKIFHSSRRLAGPFRGPMSDSERKALEFLEKVLPEKLLGEELFKREERLIGRDKKSYFRLYCHLKSVDFS